MSKSTQELMLNALKEIKTLKRQLAGYQKSAHEPIAIVGMGCRFPGGGINPDEFWNNLYQGKDCITQQENNERWDMEELYDPDPDVPGKMYSKGLGIIDDFEKFDAEFFGISPREAEDIDPQHRLLLEVTQEALDDAGYAPGIISGTKTGVYVGIASADYAHLGSIVGSAEHLTPWQGIGNALSAAPGRLSYLFNLKGPSVAFDTACSSSLTALHFACQALRQGECDMAISGGVHLVLNPAISIVFAKARMLAVDGRCKTFDADADGYVRSEGCGMLVLKRLSDAVAAGDNILALIKGSAMNQDGKSQGFTAPNEQAQEAVISAALAQGQLQPKDVSYIEAHGTGTPLGDPIELGALNAVYCAGQNRSHPLLVGSVKTNLGHSEAAAGMAGIMKLIQSIRHRTIPPHINFHKPNPYIPWNKMAIQITDKLTPWNDFAPEDGKLRGAVSGFAFTGTNVHVILEEFQPKSTEEASPAPWVPPIVLASAKQPAALAEWYKAVHAHLAKHQDSSLDQIARTTAAGRDHFKIRTALLPESREDLMSLLPAADQQHDRVLHGIKHKPTYKIAFLFSGQGAQYAGMGEQLYKDLPTFKHHFDQVAAVLDPLLDAPIADVLWGEQSSQLNQTRLTQPGLFALEYSLAKTWIQWGLKPDCLAGHSVGEISAACIAGVFSLADAAKLIVARGRLMGETQSGTMLVVFADEARVAELLTGHDSLEVCAINGPENTVVGGAPEAVAAFVKVLGEAGVSSRQLPVEHAFHTRAMEPILESYREALQGIKFNAPRIRVLSNLNGEHVGKAMADADYWVQQIRKPVRFLACSKGLLDAGIDVALEVGPGAALVSMLQDSASIDNKQSAPATIAYLRKGHDERKTFTRGLAQIYVSGLDLDWGQIMPVKSVAPVQLPSYQFQRRVFWNKALDSFLQQQDLPESTRNWLYQLQWQTWPDSAESSPSTAPWLLLTPEGVSQQTFTDGLGQRLRCGHFSVTGDAPSITVESESAAVPANGDAIALLKQQLTGNDDEPLQLVVSIAQLPTLMKQQQWHNLTALVLAIAKTVQQSQGTQLWLVTEMAYAQPGDTQPVKPEQAMVLGFAKNLVYELAGKMKSVLDVAAWDNNNLQAVINLIDKGVDRPWLSLRADQVKVPELVRREEAIQLEKSPRHLQADKWYVIAGGTGALGLALAQWMAKRGARHIALLSRSGGNSNSVELKALVKGGVSFSFPTLDLSRQEELVKVLDMLRKDRPIAGVVHAAGLFEISPLQDLDTERCSRLMDSKVLGIQWLDQATVNDELEFFVGYSSIASVWGSAGNFHYTAANQVVDAVIQRRQQQGKPALAVNWGPWAESGMVSTESAEQAAKRGLQMMDKALGTQVLGQLLDTDESQMVVADILWRPFRALMDMLFLGGMFEKIEDHDAEALLANDDVALNEEDLVFKEELLASAEADRPALLLQYLKDQLARALQCSAESVDETQPLIEMGIDSLMAVEFKNRVVKVTEVDLPVVRMLGGANLKDVAQWLAEDYSNKESGEDADDDDALVEGVL